MMNASVYYIFARAHSRVKIYTLLSFRQGVTLSATDPFRGLKDNGSVYYIFARAYSRVKIYTLLSFRQGVTFSATDPFRG